MNLPSAATLISMIVLVLLDIAAFVSGIFFESSRTTAVEFYWMAVIGIMVIASTFIALPVFFFTSFFHQQKSRTLRDTVGEVQRYGWDTIKDELIERYDRVVTRGSFNLVLPLTVLVLGVGWSFVFFSHGFDVVFGAAEGGTSGGLAAMSESHPLAFGFLGAYFFSIGYLLRRYLARDLTTHVYMHIIVRVLTVMILTFIFSAIFSTIRPSAGPEGPWPAGTIAFAFLAGITPNLFIDWIRSHAPRIRPGPSSLPLNKIQGMNVFLEARLSEEGLESAQHLAMADIVGLMASTRVGGLHLVDWIDQALLYVHVPNRLEELQNRGIRTATDFVLAFLGPLADREEIDWKNPIPGSAAFETSCGKAKPEDVSCAIAISNHPNFLQIQQLTDAAREALSGSRYGTNRTGVPVEQVS